MLRRVVLFAALVALGCGGAASYAPAPYQPPPRSPVEAIRAGDQVVEFAGMKLIPLMSDERARVTKMAREHGSMGRCDEPTHRMISLDGKGCEDEDPAPGRATALCFRCRNEESILVLASEGFVYVQGSTTPRFAGRGKVKYVEVLDRDERERLTTMLHRAGGAGDECDVVVGMLVPIEPVPGVTQATYQCQNEAWIHVSADPERGYAPRIDRLTMPPEAPEKP